MCFALNMDGLSLLCLHKYYENMVEINTIFDLTSPSQLIGTHFCRGTSMKLEPNLSRILRSSFQIDLTRYPSNLP